MTEKNDKLTDTLGKKHFKLTERVDKTNEDLDAFKTEIKRMRQSGANNSNIRKQMTQAMEGQQQAADDNNDDHIELVLGMEDQVRDLAD